MSTLNLQQAASGITSQQSGGANDIGRARTSGICTLNPTPYISPGSHATGDEWSTALQFTGVTIAQGVTLNSCYLKCTAWETYSASPNVVKFWVSAEAVDNSGALTTTNGDLGTTARPRSTATVAWDMSAMTQDVEYSVDITTVLQEIINRAGWVSGNTVNIILDTHADCTMNEWQNLWSYAGSAPKAPKLQFDYGAPAPTQMTGVILAVVR